MGHATHWPHVQDFQTGIPPVQRKIRWAPRMGTFTDAIRNLEQIYVIIVIFDVIVTSCMTLRHEVIETE